MALVNLICEKLQLKSSRPTFSNLSGFLDESFSDVTVKISYPNFETCIYKLHRNILAGCSSILHQKLVHSNKNKLEQTVDMDFMNPTEFELLVVYMYTGDIHFKTVHELCFGLYAANLYHLDSLLTTCTESLQKKLDEDCANALLILQLDERFNFRSDNAALFELVDETINTNYQQILSSQIIEELQISMLRRTLQMDTSCSVPEIEIFRALLRWTNAQCTKNKIEKDPQNLQKVAGDLIYLIRYNLIPVEKLGREVVPSQLLPERLTEMIFLKYYTEKLAVPLCNRPSAIAKNDATETSELDQENMQFESVCTKEEHKLNEVYRWKTVHSLSWNAQEDSDNLFLPATSSSNTRWMVKFWRDFSSDDFGVFVLCQSLDKQFRAVSVRLFVVVSGHPHVWTEVAAVLKSGEEWGRTRFSQKMSSLSKARPLQMRVRAQWTELDRLPPIFDLWNNGAACIQCRWQLRGLKSVTPTADKWRLHSELFGRSGVLWRIIVLNACPKNVRKLKVVVVLQYLPSSINWSGPSLDCTLFVCDQAFGNRKMNIKKDSCCWWTIIEDVKFDLPDTLNLKVIIQP